jgi:hypothetical protein
VGCLPEEYGKCGSVDKRFKHRSDKGGGWQMIFNALVEDAEHL